MRKSAGILVFRRTNKQTEVFLVHPGGPFWKNKDAGAWSIPKGEFTEEEDALTAAIREFKEETGQEIAGEFLELKSVLQKGGKQVYAWAVEGEVDADHIVSNEFKLEFPYKSGKWILVPEVDRAAWFFTEIAKEKINPGQVGLIDDLLFKLNS